MQEHVKANKHPASLHTTEPELMTKINDRENINVNPSKFDF